MKGMNELAVIAWIGAVLGCVAFFAAGISPPWWLAMLLTTWSVFGARRVLG